MTLSYSFWRNKAVSLSLSMTGLLIVSLPLAAFDINDGHLHYNEPIWKDLPPADALSLMTDSGIQRAVISSTPAEGTERLYRHNNKRIIPFIRPYRTLKDVKTWHHNPEIIDYIQGKSSSGIFKGFGEFHMWEKDLPGSILPQLMQIAAAGLTYHY